MITVAIICEYNPFHYGHLHQIEHIRSEFGSDTRIIAIMSGNYVQRGEVAVADKLTRAKSAVECGVNLVLELPFPYCASSAEFFARAGVSIADALGIVNILSFGSECGSLEKLSHIAKLTENEEFLKTVRSLTDSDPKLSHPKASVMALETLAGKDYIELSPNNLLGIEYIKALNEIRSSVLPHTIQRFGANYRESDTVSGSIQSATAIRALINREDRNWVSYLPSPMAQSLTSDISNGSAPCDINRLSSMMIGHLRLNLQPANDSIHEAGGGLYNRLSAMSLKANTFNELTNLAVTGKYTASRIRRAILNSILGVTSSAVRERPAYTQLLAMDSDGRAMLKQIRKHGNITVITKPSRIDEMTDEGRKQKELADKADSLFQLTKPIPPNGAYSLQMTPFVKD